MSEDAKLKALMEQYSQDLKGINEGMRVLLDKVPKIEQKLDATFEAAGELQVDINFVISELKEIRKELSDKISRKEYRALERRVGFLEKQLKV